MAASDLPASVRKLGEFQGAKGEKGDTGTFASASASTLAPGSPATVEITGPESAKAVAFGIPRGNTGAAGTITDVTTTTLPAGSAATVSLGGTPSARTIALGIPRGDAGGSDAATAGYVSDSGSQTNAALQAIVNAAKPGKASTTARGLVELATQTESNQGTAGVVPDAAAVKTSFDVWDAIVRPVRNLAVVVGSSNASNTAASWPSKLGNARGLSMQHYAVGGSGYMTPTDGFLVQLQRAVAAMNATQRAATGFVFICDASNDARANRAYADMLTAATNVYSYARANFPNARIVVIPMVWPADTEKYAPAAIGGYQVAWNASALVAAQAQQDALREYRNAVYADQSWTWLTGRDELMLANGDVHPGEYGHNILANYIERVIDGETIIGRQEWRNAVPKSGRTLGGRGRPLAARRDGWLVTVEGSVQSTAGFTNFSDFATLPYGCRPTYGIPLNAKWTSLSTGNPPVELFPDGTVRVYDSGGANTGPIISHTFTLG